MIACVWVPCFSAAAAERCEPALAERPLAIVEGVPPVARVVEANAPARAEGVGAGMTETEARARCPALVSRPFSPERVASAQHALLETALAVSPRLEDARPGLVYADVAGLGRLIGDAAAIGQRLVGQARAVRLPARVGIASGRTVARVAVKTATLPVVVVPPGAEQATLAPAPLAVLDLPPEVEATLGRWGVRTLGELAALPREGLAARLGPAGLRAHDLALGRDPDPFRAWVPPPFWEEAQELDWEVGDLERLLAVLRGVLERLAARLAAAHLYADVLDVGLALASGGRHERTIALAYPARDTELMLMLLRRELEACPPAASVAGVAVSLHPVRGRAGQAGLWQPPAPRHRDLTGLLARLVRLVGGENVGSPVLDDSHRPDAFTLVPFAPPDEADAPAPRRGQDPRQDPPAPGGELEHPLVLRRFRPPPPVEVITGGKRPVGVQWGASAARVLACAGPWRASGEWWDMRAWARDEWDVLLGDGTLYRLARDHVTGQWYVDGVYD